MQKQTPFWIFTASVLIALLLPALLQDGMFMDGMLYACISKNLSQGIGSFWFPHFSKTLYSFFDQQPPLGFWIQSLFFKLFGDSIYVERIYSFLTTLITAYLIILLWRMIFKNESEIKKLGWLPVLFWIIIPVCFWSYSNNMLENTMGIFDLLAVICIVKYFQKQSVFFVLLSGIFICLASLTKGFQGMFPLVALAAGWIVYRNVSFKKMLLHSLLPVFVICILCFLILQNDSAFKSLSAYLHNRVLNSIQNAKDVTNRFYLLYRLFTELLPVLILGAIITMIAKFRTKNGPFPILFFKKDFLFFLLIGFSASLPLMITLEQRGFYLVTSFPYYAIALAILVAPHISGWIEKTNTLRVGFRLFRIFSILALAVVFAFSFLQIGRTGRDADTIHDVKLIGGFVPSGTTLGSTRELWEKWSLQEYLVRHYYICQADRISPEDHYLLLENENQNTSGIKIEKVNIATVKYHLYKVIR